jgi:hypothetical protein
VYLLEKNGGAKPLEVSRERKERLKEYLAEEIEDGFSSRATQEALWVECLKLYEAIPEVAVRQTPLEGYRNLEVPLIAISADAIYAQAVDLIFTVSPMVTVQAVEQRYIEGAKGLQRYVNWGVSGLFGTRNAAEHAILDDVQLGSGFYYCPWVEKRKKTKTDQLLIGGPRIFSVPPEDFLVPGGATDDLQTLPWVAMRNWFGPGEFGRRAIAREWDTEGVMPAGGVDWVRSRREVLGRTSSGGTGRSLFEILDVYCLFDIDGDGIEEDLRITYDRTTQKVMQVKYNPFDTRPFSAMRYQLRGHLFYGMGVAEMLRTLQHEDSEIHNHRIINMMLANTRMFASRSGSLPSTIAIWPGRNLSVSDPNDIKELKLSEVYPSSNAAEASAVLLAESRTGMNALSMPKSSQVLGNRTPGITMMSLMQKQNQRFTPAFDGMRLATAEAVRQCLYRTQERLLARDRKTERMLVSVAGAEAAAMIDLLTRQDFDEAVQVELTASSAQQNREVERQNQLLLVNLMSQYYKGTLEMSIIMTNPQTPPAVKEVAEKIVKAATEVMERTLRTFDSVRDPETLLVEMSTAVEGMIPGVGAGQPETAGLARLFAQLGGMSGGEANGLPPAAFGSA